MPGINTATNVLTIPEGSPYRLRLRIRGGDGAYEDLSSEAVELAFYRGRDVLRLAEGTIASDATSSYALMQFGNTVTVALNPTSARWHVSLGGSVIFDGVLAIPVGVSSEDDGSIDELLWDRQAEKVTAVMAGPRGPSPWQQAGQTYDEWRESLIADSRPVWTTITTDYVASAYDHITADTTASALTITLPPSGGPVVIRMAEAMVPNLLTIAGNGRTIDGGTSMTSADWAGYEITFASSGAAWTYAAAYIYGGAE